MVITAAKRGHHSTNRLPQGVWAYLFVERCPFHAFHAQITRVSAGTNWQLKTSWLPAYLPISVVSFAGGKGIKCKLADLLGRRDAKCIFKMGLLSAKRNLLKRLCERGLCTHGDLKLPLYIYIFLGLYLHL